MTFKVLGHKINLVVVFVLAFILMLFIGFSLKGINASNNGSTTSHIITVASAKMTGNKTISNIKGYSNQTKAFYRDNKKTIKQHPSCKRSTILIPFFTELDKADQNVHNQLNF